MKADLNTFDIIFEQLPSFFKCELFEIPNKISMLTKSYNKKIDAFYKKLAIEIKKIYCECDGSVKSSYELWSSKFSYIENIIFDDDMKKIYQSFNAIQFDDKQSIDKLAHAICNSAVSDWNSKKYSLFISKLISFKELVENFKETSVSKETVSIETPQKELSLMAKTLLNNLEDELFEYGEAVSNEEKVLILHKLLNKILN